MWEYCREKEMKSGFILLLVSSLSGCMGVMPREETQCVATRTLDVNGKARVMETCVGTSVRRGYPTFEKSGVNQKW